MHRFILITGCSGGGKSTLLAELARCGFATVEEPGRRIVREELARGGAALPWDDAHAFLQRALAMAIADREAARLESGLVFFDRGVLDAAVALQHLTGDARFAEVARTHRYNPTVVLAPPWPELFASDAERRHDFDAAVAEYERMSSACLAMGYDTYALPRVTLAERAHLVRARFA